MVLSQTKPHTWLLAAAVAVLALALMPSMAAASHSNNVVLVDDSDTTSDVGGCGSNANKCNTIQAGVDHASAGQTVRVAAGTYNETVTVPKTLKLEGAQKGKDATTRNVAITKESVVTSASATGTFNLEANKVSLDGFIVENNAAGPGVRTGPTFSGYKVAHNIIRNNVFGLYLHGSGEDETEASRNFFNANNLVGAANANGIYSDQGLKNAEISRNKFTQHDGPAITLTKGSAAQPNNNDIEISRNTSIEDGTVVNLYHSDDVEISRNVARGINDPAVDGTAIYLAGNNHDVEISRNEIRNRSWTGIAIDNRPEVSAVNTNIMIERNVLRNLGNDGIDVRSGSVGDGDVTVDHNEVRQVAKDGILFGLGTSGNLIEDNEMRNNTHHDAHDDSVGTGTAGTANTWEDNECVTDLPDGLCEAD